MKLCPLQTSVSKEAAEAIRAAASDERVAVSDYLRRAVDQHLEGRALMDPVRVALADAATTITQHALGAIEAATVRSLEEVRAEREENRKQISDFVELLAATFNPTPTASEPVKAPARPHK